MFQVAALNNGITNVTKENEDFSTRIKEAQETVEEKAALLASLEQQCQKAEEALSLNAELLVSTEDHIHSLQTMLKVFH